MDLLDFSDCGLYFEAPLPAEVQGLVDQAGQEVVQDRAELALLRAHLLAPENLTVLVGLYRCYFFQHRLPEALHVAERAMQLSGRQLGLPTEWQRLDEARLGTAASNSFGLLRFYLLALKAAGVLLLRLGRFAASRERLEKLVRLDRRDQMGAAKLLQAVDQFHPRPASPDHPFAFVVA